MFYYRPITYRCARKNDVLTFNSLQDLKEHVAEVYKDLDVDLDDIVLEDSVYKGRNLNSGLNGEKMVKLKPNDVNIAKFSKWCGTSAVTSSTKILVGFYSVEKVG